MAELLFQGHGSLRMITKEGKVIYIDPFAGEGYDRPADLILVTHQHSDHNQINLPVKNSGCVVWQNNDALAGGKYNRLELEYASVEAVEAYNRNHLKQECVGYIVTADGIQIYFAGDTGTTKQMAELAERELDYAVLPMDAQFTMDVDEAIHCAELIGAKHTIPIHMMPGKLFDKRRAERFQTESRLIVQAGETIQL